MKFAGMEALLQGDWEQFINTFTFDEPAGANNELLGALETPNRSTSQHTMSSYEQNFLDDIFTNNMADDSASYHYGFQAPTSHENSSTPIQYYSDFPMPPNRLISTDIYMMDEANDSLLAAITFDDGGSSSSLMGVDDGQSSSPTSISMELEDDRKRSAPLQQAEHLKQTKKRSRNSKSYKGKKEKPPKRRRCLDDDESDKEENSNVRSNEQTISSETSSDDGSGVNSDSTTSKGKKRAGRGQATDPQSLYARRRRERINERLRILQSLVPNGKKVDISTMLEEAVHYVKFLQLQIRLLGSDDLWMYAPIAYNAIDVNLFRRISPFSLQ